MNPNGKLRKRRWEKREEKKRVLYAEQKSRDVLEFRFRPGTRRELMRMSGCEGGTKRRTNERTGGYRYLARERGGVRKKKWNGTRENPNRKRGSRLGARQGTATWSRGSKSEEWDRMIPPVASVDRANQLRAPNARKHGRPSMGIAPKAGRQRKHAASSRPELAPGDCQEIAKLCTFHLEIPNLVPINLRLSMHWPGNRVQYRS